LDSAGTVTGMGFTKMGAPGDGRVLERQDEITKLGGQTRCIKCGHWMPRPHDAHDERLAERPVCERCKSS